MNQSSGMRAPNPDRSCVEARGLALGLRRAWRLRLPRSALRLWHQTMTTLGLHLAASKTTFALLEGGQMVAANDGVHLVVIGQDAEIARACLGVELANVGKSASETWQQLTSTLRAHHFLGQAYGYPKCCVDAFCDAHVDAVLSGDQCGDNGLAIARAAARTGTYHRWLAALPGAFGVATKSTLRHLPCSFDCDASIELAGKLLADLESLDKRRFGQLYVGQRSDLHVDAHGRISGSESALGSSGDESLSGLAEDRTRSLWRGQTLPIVLPFAQRG
ncbi:MAG: hypothetical protein CMH53_04750 [Myxococcales bacterium]|nr:hypothetical protein [Myxococcales bacterium]|tara:strand:- start:472 stop:1299 length:828 start_codon:yes stop_codon:yes gene_type:complete